MPEFLRDKVPVGLSLKSVFFHNGAKSRASAKYSVITKHYVSLSNLAQEAALCGENGNTREWDRSPP